MLQQLYACPTVPLMNTGAAVLSEELETMTNPLRIEGIAFLSPTWCLQSQTAEHARWSLDITRLNPVPDGEARRTTMLDEGPGDPKRVRANPPVPDRAAPCCDVGSRAVAGPKHEPGAQVLAKTPGAPPPRRRRVRAAMNESARMLGRLRVRLQQA